MRNVQNSEKYAKFREMFKIMRNVQNSEKYGRFREMCRIQRNIQNIWEMCKIQKILDKFTNFKGMWYFWSKVWLFLTNVHHLEGSLETERINSEKIASIYSFQKVFNSGIFPVTSNTISYSHCKTWRTVHKRNHPSFVSNVWYPTGKYFKFLIIKTIFIGNFNRGVNSFLKLEGQVVMRFGTAARHAPSILTKSGRGLAIAPPPFIDAPDFKSSG